jgi:N-acetylmuramoyl-L-alanine amidase
VIRTLARATVKWISGWRGCRYGAIGLCGLAAVGLAVLCLGVSSLAPAAAQMPAPPAPPAATAPAGTEAPPVATDARLAGDDKQTRLVVDLTRKVDLRAFTLPDPYRVVIDIPEVTFRLAPHTGEHGRGLVKAFRYGLVMPGGSRIVIDGTGPVRVLKAFVVDPIDDEPARMVVDLAPVDRETFLRAAAIDNRLARLADPPPTRPTRHDRDPQPARPADPRLVVVLDPGHGGIDTGTHAPSGELEKDLALEFATMLRDKLEKTGKYRLAMTRTDDTFVPLAERVRFARLHQAQLFISIHCDALARGAGAAEGASVYTLSEKASDAEAARLADAENRADVIAGVNLASEPSDIADILIDLAQRETNAFSANFARNVVSALRAAARLYKNPLKSAGFRVLKAPDVPSVLIELGYISDAGDLKQLLSASWRSRTGDAIMQAVNTYFATRLAGVRSGATTGSR